MRDYPSPTATRVLRACPVCGAGGASPERSLRDHLSGEAFTLTRCPECGALFLGDPPAPADLHRYYETDSGEAMRTPPGKLFAMARRRRIQRDLRPLLERVTPPQLVIDVGTGDGSVARELAALGFVALAVDVYDEADWTDVRIPYRRYSIDVGLAAADLQLGGRRPAGAVLRHVLEHVPDPADTLRGLHAGGVDHVLVIVPNADSCFAGRLGERWYYWDPPRHLTFFTAPTLTRLAERCGFRISHLSTYGLDEVVCSTHRARLLRRGGRADAISDLLRPTGLAAGTSSALAAVPGATVLQAVLSRAPEAA